MAGLKLGITFDAPVKQTILPVIITYKQAVPPKGTSIDPTAPPVLLSGGALRGFFFIPETSFTGTERTFAMAEGPMPIMSFQKGPHNIDGSGFDQNTEQFMAAVWDVSEDNNQPWLGFDGWIANSDTGMYARWVLASQQVHLLENWGALYGSFKVRLNLFNASVAPTPPGPPTGQDGEMTWVSQADWDALGQDCAFFDVNWFDKFQASYTRTTTLVDGSTAGVPISITPLTVPPQFKVMVVRAGTNMELAQGGNVFNTLRFIRVLTTPPGDYTFTFRIDQGGQSINVTMTLTVVKR